MLYIDSADRDQVERLLATGLFAGVTTNPTILRRSGLTVDDAPDVHRWARAAGAEVTTVALAPSDWSLDLAAVRAAIRPRTRLLVVNFPHSPTGALIDRTMLRELVALAEHQGAWLLSDEVYRGLELEAGARLPCAADLSPRAVSIGVMSKTYGLAGLRIGWIATRDAALRMRLAALKDYTTICNAAPSEVLALIALRARERVIERSMTIIRGNVALVDAFVRRHAERVAWVPPRAGSVAFPRLREEDAEAFGDALVREAGVLLLPGALFDLPGGHFRIGLGRRALPDGLARLEEFMRTHPRVGASAGAVAGTNDQR